jgi:hypothetical protein
VGRHTELRKTRCKCFSLRAGTGDDDALTHALCLVGAAGGEDGGGVLRF